MRLFESVYPDIPTPATDNELKSIYDFFNNKFFNNDLPESCRIRFVHLAKNMYGKAHIKFPPEGGVDYLITVATSIQNNSKKLVDIMGHECIHIWQYMMWQKTGSMKYTD